MEAAAVLSDRTPREAIASMPRHQLRLSPECDALLDEILDGETHDFDEAELAVLTPALCCAEMLLPLHLGAALDQVLNRRLRARAEQAVPAEPAQPELDFTLMRPEALDLGPHSAFAEDFGFSSEPPTSRMAADTGEHIPPSEPLLIESEGVGAFRDLQTMMTCSFFAPDQRGKGKETWTRKVAYASDQIEFTISPNVEYGMATIYDKDLLIWIISKLNDMLIRGDQISDWLKFRPSQFFAETRRTPVGGAQYAQLESALNRLKGTMVKISHHQLPGELRAVPYQWTKAFCWIEEFSWVKRGRRLEEVSVRLPGWIYQQLKAQGGQKMLLNISPDYFELTNYIDRVLYSIARKACGEPRRHGAKNWDFRCSTLFERCYPDRKDKGPLHPDNQAIWRLFKRQIRDRATNLPDTKGDGILTFDLHYIDVDEDGKRMRDPMITFIPRRAAP